MVNILKLKINIFLTSSFGCPKKESSTLSYVPLLYSSSPSIVYLCLICIAISVIRQWQGTKHINIAKQGLPFNYRQPYSVEE